MAITSGDIAIVGFITNGNPDDSFSILTLAPIAAGEVIYFTDNGWTGSAFRGVSATDADGNENLLKLTINTPIAAGTVIRTNDTGASFTWTSGSVVSGAAGSFLPIALAQTGDQITAVQSTNANPLLSGFTPIFQIDNTGTFENATTSGTGSLVSGLSVDVNNAVLLNNLATTAKFKLDTLAGGSKEQWLAAINNPANWTFDSSAILLNSSVTVADTTPPTDITPPTGVPPSSPIVKIHSIQGSGTTFNTAFSGTRSIEGIVTSVFAGATKLNGFYIQEEDADIDADATTSEGIFVFDSSNLLAGVAAGTKVRVTGNVGEFATTATGIAGSASSSLTQITASEIINLGAAALPTTTNIFLPVADTRDLERYEGMLVSVKAATGHLTVTETFKLGRFGQVGLSAGGRIDQYTQTNAPSVTGYATFLANVLDNYIILDDGSSTQNPDPTIHARGGQPLSATNTLRGGDTITEVNGVLDQRFEGYRVQTTTPANFLPTNAREAVAPAVGGTLKVASFNLLNFFNGSGIDSNRDGLIDSGFPTARGADTAIEFKRQLDKTVKAILGLNPDIFGYNEIENDGFGANSAVQTLVNALNAEVGAGTYTFVVPPASALDAAGKFGGDEIAVGFIYKANSVRIAPGTNPAALTTGVFDQVTARVQRPPLAVTFERLANGVPTSEIFTAVNNHFKSKGSSAGGAGDGDAADGQGLSNGTRTRASQQLAAWLATNPTGTTDGDNLILGDLNSYRLEDPITTLTTAGYTSLFGSESYSYQFNGQWGSLDHALANSSLNTQVAGAAKWHINSDEPTVLDYNTEFKTPGQVTNFYAVDPYRTSDHDPIVVGLNLQSSTITQPPVIVQPPADIQPKITNYDFTDLPKLGTASFGQDIFLGGFSGLYFQGLAANGNLKFVTNTDRGPNGEPTGANRPFLLPSFQPEIVSFELNRQTGKIDITKRTGLFRADGTTPLTGLPNLQAQANGLAYTDEVGVDLAGKVLPNDPFGADVEGIVVAANGDYWLVDEYRPAIYHFDINGKLLDRFIPKGTAVATEPDSAPGTFGTEVLPEVYAQRRSNRGFEAVALDGDKLYAFIQSPIDNPDNGGDTASRASRNLRILEFNTVSKTVTGEYVYLLDNIAGSGNAKTDKLGDAVALGNGKFALVERDDLATSASNKLIYQIDLAGATNINNPANFTLPAGKTIEQLTAAELTTAKITPVSKSLIANAAQLGYTGVEKLEGLALVAPNTLALINDNDFNVAGGNVPERLGILELTKDLPVAKPAFPNGVASGDTTQDSTVLWTRANALGNVTFEYSTQADFSSIAGTKTATVTNALQPVKVNVDGLTANTDYFYRVTDANGAKLEGKFSTAAALGNRTGLKFGASGDWRGELAPYPSIGNADTANLKFFIALGDTIYGDVASPAVRNPDGSEKSQATTLADYRAKQAEVYSSRFGQNTLGDLRANTSILATIDDHEVTNDFAGGENLATASATSQALYGAAVGLVNDSPLFENGLQAFQEFNPIKDLTYSTPTDARTDGERKLYRANTFGSDAATFILDTRSFRDTELPGVTNLADQAQVGKFLVDSFDPTRTLLGKQQIEDLKKDLLKSQQDGVTWKFITVPEPIQNIGVLAASDRFEGYAAERTEILKFIDDNKISNVVFVAADIHGTLVNNLTYQTAPGQAQIATSAFEITTGSVGYSEPFGQTVANLGAASGVITPAQKAFYDSLPTAGQDGFIKGLVDGGLNSLGYDPLGLDKNLTQANGLINAKLLQGDYVATHVYGWTEFNIDQKTQKLTVTTYGIDPYTRAELEANPAAITSRQPKIVSQFEVVPSATDLELTQVLDNSNPGVGDQVSFTLTISNKGAILADGIKVADLLPKELSFVSATAAQGTYDNKTGLWDVGAIDVKGSTTLKITAKVDVNGSLTNKAEIIGQKQADVDSTPNNNVATEDDQASVTFNPQALVAGTTNANRLEAGITPGFDGKNDVVFAGAGNDTVDVAIAGAGNNRIDAGSGNDVVFVADADRLFGSLGDDEFEATEAKDYRASGGGGNDTFFLGTNGRSLGGEGNDKFFVGAGGGNLLSGGTGTDQFWIASGDVPATANTILDFQIGIDVVGIQGIGANASNIVLSQIGADTSIGFGGQSLALLKGIQATSLNLGNTNQFIFV